MQINIRPVPAPALTGLQATPGLKQVALSWTIPPDPTYRASLVYSGTGAGPETATLIATVTGNTFTALTDDATAKNYWVRSKNIYDRVDGAWSNGVSGSGKLIQSSDIADGAVNLSKHVTGYLSSANVSGLGALAALNAINLGTDVIGALDSSKVNNLGQLAFADSLAANKIGAGQLAAGVVYAGQIEANQIKVGTMTGHTIQTAAFGQRITINSAGDNRMKAYDSNGSVVASIGGSSSGHIFAANTAGVGIPAMWIESNSSSTYGISVQGYGGGGVYANVGAASAIIGNASSGNGGSFYASSGNALSIEGRVMSTPYAETSGKGFYTNNCVPVTDNTYNLGTYSNRWMNIVSASPVIVSSDARMKTEIADSDLGLEFIDSLRPVSYKMIEGRKEISHAPEQMGPWPGGMPPPPEVIATPVAGARRHYGLIAQEVRQALGDRDAAFWTLENPADQDSAQALRYEELISPLIKAVQELHALVKAQQAEIDTLKAAL